MRDPAIGSSINLNSRTKNLTKSPSKNPTSSSSKSKPISYTGLGGVGLSSKFYTSNILRKSYSSGQKTSKIEKPFQEHPKNNPTKTQDSWMKAPQKIGLGGLVT
jgi:hypothetical protein